MTAAVIVAFVMGMGQAQAAPCSPADLNGDGQIDFADYLDFLNRYDSGDLSVDFNGDGMVDFSDYLVFLNLYDAGCPTCSTTATDLAANPLPGFPFAQHVNVYPNSALVYISVDPFKHPGLTGKTTRVYITPNNTWASGMPLTDVRGPFQNVTWAGGSVAAQTVALTGSAALLFDAGENIGIPYDIVIDENNNGVFDGCDFADGAGADAGFYKVRDLTTANAGTAVTQVNLVLIPAGRTTAGLEAERWYYPSDIAGRGRIPLVLISHGNGHLYTWYDHLGQHLASYGMIVISHANNTGPGIAACKITQLDHMNTVVALQATLNGGVLNNHIDTDRLYTVGHSRGGDGVANLLDDLYEGTYAPTGGFPLVISFDNYKYAMEIAGTDFLGPNEGNPHTANFHLLYGAADGDVSGIPDNDIADSFNLFERAEQRRSSTYIHGATHSDFNCCGNEPSCGGCPTFIGRPEAQKLQKAYTLAAMQYYGDGSVPCRELLWRQYEDIRPTGSSAADTVDLEFKDFGAGTTLVIDDFQSNPATNLSSSGGAVLFSPGMSPSEGVLNDTDGSFTWPGDVMNGMTRAATMDVTKGLVINYDVTAASRSIVWDIALGARDTRPYESLSFRACQRTRHTNTIAIQGDQDFEVELEDGSGNTSRMPISVYGGGLEEPYPRTGSGAGTGWQNEFETVRLRLSDFQANGRTLDLGDIRKVRMFFGAFHGSAEGAIGIDDLEWSK